MNLRILVKLSVGMASIGLLGGCYTQSTVYRAVSDVAITRPGDVGSAGPLVLVAGKPGAVKAEAPKPDVGGAIDRMSLDQIGVLDPKMGLLLRAQHDAESNLVDLKSAPTPNQDKIHDAETKAKLATQQVDDFAREWRLMQKRLVMANNPSVTVEEPPKEGMTASADQSQTVLMASEKKSFGIYSSNFEHTFVLIIDGHPKPGEYWLTPDNSVLITSSAWSAPARNRVGLTGSIKILEVHGNKILANVAVRETTEPDSTEWFYHYYDPAYYQTPWLILGTHTFEVTSPSDPAFEKARVHWVTE